MTRHLVVFGYFFIGLCFLSTSSFAQRIILTHDVNSEAKLQTKLISSNQEMGSIEVQLNIPSIELSRESNGFQKVRVNKLAPLGIAGQPDLGVTGVLLAVPDGYELQATLNHSYQKSVPNVMVAPFQKKFRCDCDLNNNFAFDGTVYNSDKTFLNETIRVETVGKLQDLSLQRISIQPMNWNAKSKELVVMTELSLQVDFVKTSNQFKPIELPQSIYQVARTSTANGQALGNTVRPSTRNEVMMIFVADDLKNSISELVKWEKAKGIDVKVMTLTEAGGSKETIKTIVQKQYDTRGKLSYMIFVGNKDTMPPFYESTASGPAATDYTYALLSGGMSDPIPDALYGRIVANTEAEVKTQINRWINYEKNPEKGANWYSKASTIASNEGFDPSDAEYAERVRTALTDHTFNTADAFEQGGNKTGTPENITKAVNEGRSWIAYFGHGDGKSWGSIYGGQQVPYGEYNIANVKALTNTNRLPIIIDVACLNAAYNKYEDLFGKTWVTHEVDNKPAGAVAFYGGSVLISWHPPAIMSEGIAKQHFEKPVRTLGGSVLAGQLYLVEQKGDGDENIDNIKWYNLFGDPSLLVRTAAPLAYTVKKAIRKLPTRVEIEVYATASNGDGVKGLRVALGANNSSSVAVGTSDTDGKTVLSIPSLSTLEPNSMLTVTGYNAETMQIKVN